MQYCLVTILFVSGVSSLQLNISSPYIDAGVSGAVFNVRCKSDERLTHCHFKWCDIYNNEGPLIDLSEGPKTPVAANYSYLGSGLDKGECGIALNRPPGVHRWTITCRVRSKDSGWHYNHTTLFAHLKSATTLKTSPRQITVRPGANVTVQCNSDALVDCEFRLPDGSLPTFNSGAQLPSTSYKYFGAGLSQGECGISLYDVTESNNGFVWCHVWKNNSDGWRSFVLTVAARPSTPVLQVKLFNYSRGDVLKVSCTVERALPVAFMIWYLDGKVIRQDHVNEARTESWLWPFQVHTIKQTLTRELIGSDDGKELTCKIKQVDDAMPEVQSSHIISFYKEPTAPESVELKLESRVFKEGDTLSASCTVKGAYPAGQVTWFLGSSNLTRRVISTKNGTLVDTVTVQLRGDDDGKEVACVVRHPRLPQPVRKASAISVEHSPQRFQETVEQFRFNIGNPGVATVEVMANPKPSIYWTMDDATLQEGTTDITGCYEAAFLVKSVSKPNVWVAQLFINDVTLRDLKMIFFLNARNKFGGEYFRCVNFNTTPPAAVLAAPSMTLSPIVDYYSVGASITAICTVTGNRPIGTIRWLLSNVTLTSGVGQLTLLRSDPLGKHVMVQSVTLQVEEKDDRSLLKCIAGDKEIGRQILVKYPPKKITPIIELYGFQVGTPGVLSVEISANPQPRVMWEVRGMLIQQNEVAADKRYHAPEVFAMAPGKWMAKLFITNIAQVDIGSDFALTCRNLAGSRTYHVRLFSSKQVGSNISETTAFKEPSTGSKLVTPTILTDVSGVHKYSTMETKSDSREIKVKPDYSTTTAVVDQDFPRAERIAHRSSVYSYLSIGNSIAILVLSFLCSVVYVRLQRSLLRASQGLDRAPMCLENIYYNEMNGSERPCALTSNQQDFLTCDS